jgi:hypothetical protein
MTWSKVCDSLHGHPKAMDAGLEAMGLWVLALSYCGAYLTDGHVKRSAAARLAGGRLDDLADALVRVGLWELHPTGDGWQIHDYLDFNPDGETVRRDREQGRKRAAASHQRRKSSGEDTAKTTRSNGEASPVLQRPDPDPDPDPVPDPNPAPPAPSAAAPVPEVFSRASDVDRLGAFGMEGTWWSEGVAKASGGAPLPVGRWDLRDLSQALAVQFKGLSQQDLEKAVRDSAEQYYGTLRDKQGASVRGYIAWLRTMPVKPAAPTSRAPVPTVRREPVQPPLEKPPLTPAENASYVGAILESLGATPKHTKPDAEETKAAGGAS